MVNIGQNGQKSFNMVKNHSTWSNCSKMVKHGQKGKTWLNEVKNCIVREQFELICSTGIFANPGVRPRPARPPTLTTSSSRPAMYSSSNVGQISFSYLLCDQNLIPARRSPSNFGQLSLPFLLCCVDAHTKI